MCNRARTALINANCCKAKSAPWETEQTEKTWRDLHVYRDQRKTIQCKHKDMCELGDKGSVASVTRYKRPRADSSHGASSMLFHHSPCQNLHWRNFTQAVRHLAWATNQRKQQNTKEWRSQFLGNRESYRNLEHISVNTISTLVIRCTVGTTKTSFQHLLTLIKLPQYLLELWKK